MKTATFSAVAFLALSVSAAPAPTKDADYTPPGGWESIDYPAPPGGWESVKYPPGTGETPSCQTNAYPFTFTSSYKVVATPDQVVNGTTPTGGLKDAIGYYNFGINSNDNTICYHITLHNFRGEYQSPARTATHIHEAAKGASGPRGKKRVSIGCLTGPFTTGIVQNGKDTGEGFHISQIEKNPAGFFADVHSSLAVPGAVRGQLA
ncbi:hypothetical protein B0J12DRAFT_714751 [Macrophomina phaseolina]|uniref:CHRD domain-containing protein n=1 Tax=Macrophomina phaseolina TaxID=35725 RepID=A0ABQ8FR49_9PEZI|nr:hypothetical protein B0J12DRAFT_714751 [Macrophomina phaseolina]